VALSAGKLPHFNTPGALVMGAEGAAEPLYYHSEVMEKVTPVVLPVQL
jgi:hypothetical protein